MSNVFSLHPPKHPISHVVRIGHTGHKILENLYTAGRAPIVHALTQSARAIEHLSNQPELKRIDHLLGKITERLNSDLESVPIALSPISNVNPVKKAG